MGKKSKERQLLFLVLIAYLIAYGIFSWTSLGDYPFMHSDESWLAGLTRDMMVTGDFGISEGVFDAKPRVPHGFKLLFHGLQMGYLSALGFHLETVRLLSWTAGILCLLLCYVMGKRLGGGCLGLGLAALVSVDIQFIYASHFARQEILLCVVLLACLWVLVGCGGQPSVKQGIVLACMTGAGAGIHPNGFLIAMVCGSVLVAGVWGKEKKRKDLCSLLVYVGITGLLAAVLVGISFRFDPGFLPDYFRYGEEEYELSRSVWGRLGEFLAMFGSIYNRESGTYYLPDLRLELLGMTAACGLVMLGWAVLKKSVQREEMAWCRHTRVLVSGLLGLVLGMVIIGRYNQLSIIFFLLFGWLFVGQGLLLFEGKGRYIGLGVIWLVLAYSSVGQVQQDRQKESDSYRKFLTEISRIIPGDAKTLGNLNMGFAFGYDRLRDYRNLPFVEQGAGIGEYVRDNGIAYICYTDELDFIYHNRPYYNVIYGNAMFVESLKEYCETSCEKVGEVKNRQYGARIIALLDDPEYQTVTIYRVTD